MKKGMSSKKEMLDADVINRKAAESRVFVLMSVSVLKSLQITEFHRLDVRRGAVVVINALLDQIITLKKTMVEYKGIIKGIKGNKK